MPHHDRNWQKTLLPFMQSAIVLLTIFYLLISYRQFSYFAERVEKPPSAALQNFIGSTNMQRLMTDSATLAEKRWAAQCFFEAYVLEARQQNAEFLMMSRTWIKYLGFVTGVVLCVVGAVFVLGKLSDANGNELGGEGAGAKFTLKSHSPGIIMSVLGTALIISTILTHHNVEKTDAAVYLLPAYSERHLPDSLMNNLLETADSLMHQQPDSTAQRPAGF